MRKIAILITIVCSVSWVASSYSSIYDDIMYTNSSLDRYEPEKTADMLGCTSNCIGTGEDADDDVHGNILLDCKTAFSDLSTRVYVCSDYSTCIEDFLDPEWTATTCCPIHDDDGKTTTDVDLLLCSGHNNGCDGKSVYIDPYHCTFELGHDSTGEHGICRINFKNDMSNNSDIFDIWIYNPDDPKQKYNPDDPDQYYMLREKSHMVKGDTTNDLSICPGWQFRVYGVGNGSKDQTFSYTLDDDPDFSNGYQTVKVEGHPSGDMHLKQCFGDPCPSD